MFPKQQHFLAVPNLKDICLALALALWNTLPGEIRALWDL